MTINEDTNLNAKPMILKPAIKNYLWGGTRLHDDFNKEFSEEPIAETWECSTHDDGLSLVASGMYKGFSLKEVLNSHPEYFGEKLCENGELPFLIKFIDASKDLSIQVHPDDEYAFLNENGSRGKTEFWYVVDAKKNAKLIYGLKRTIDKSIIKKSIENGTIGKYLNNISIKKNDVFFIEPGTIHAIGAGALIVEIQQSSNITYRLFDYNRLDKQGKQRELHVKKGMDVINLNPSVKPVQPMRIIKYMPGSASEVLVKCKYFTVERYLVNTQINKNLVKLYAKGCYFVLVCIDGCGVIHCNDEQILIFKGDTVFVPANSAMEIHGKMQLLKVKP